MQSAKSLFSELYEIALRTSFNYRLSFKIFNSMSIPYRSAELMFGLKYGSLDDLQPPKPKQALGD
jgi:hypothetical protein